MREYLRRFRRWKHVRPFTGGVCLLIAAVFIGLPALSGFRIGDVVLTLSSVSGVSTVWLSVLMALCGVAALFWLRSRLLAGLSGMVIALVAFPAANFGGYILGTLFGIMGASFTLAWRPLPEDQEDPDADSSGDGVTADQDTAALDTSDQDTEILPVTTLDAGDVPGAVTREIPVDATVTGETPAVEPLAEQAPVEETETDEAQINDAQTSDAQTGASPAESDEVPR